MSPLVQSPRNRGRVQPYRDLDDVHLHLDRVFQQLVDPAAMAAEAVWTPPVDIEETDDAWLIEAELPGVKRDDVTVEMQREELVIHGELKERERSGIIRRRARRTGAFEFRVRLPGDIDENAIEANLSGGVLSVRAPKKQAQSHRIEVREGE
jgi:HSP20 family protein